MGDIALKGYLGGVSSGGNLAQVGVTNHALDVNVASGTFSVSTGPITPTKGTLTDRSGTITAGGAAQQVAAANANRQYFLFENVSDQDMWINFGVAAVAANPSFKIVPTGSLVMESSFITTESISVFAATTGKAFSAKEA
jgi:hypothetical protein